MCDLDKNSASKWIFQPQKRPQAHSSSFLALKFEDQRILRMQKRFVWKSRRGQAPSFCEQRKLVNIHAFYYFHVKFSGTKIQVAIKIQILEYCGSAL